MQTFTFFDEIAVLAFVSIDVAFLFFFQYFVDGNEYARLFDVSEFVIDSCPEHAHRRRKAHIAVDQRGNVESQRAYFLIQYFVIFFERVVFGEYPLQLFIIAVRFERCTGPHEFFGIGKMLVEEMIWG